MRGHRNEQLRQDDRLHDDVLRGGIDLLPERVLHADVALLRPVRRDIDQQLRPIDSVFGRLPER
jgi:hypothetical protein